MRSAEDKITERKALIVDVDGTLCPIKTAGEDYADLPVYMEMVKALRAYKEKGFEIVLHTARNMKTHEGNLGKINAKTAPKLIAWLDKHGIPYDEIYYGKPWPGSRGFYIDDRAVRPREFLRCSEEILDAQVESDRRVTKGPTQVVISMAGGSSRFVNAGISTPKYQISVKGLSLFYWSLLSLTHHIRANDIFYFITLKEHEAHEFIGEQCDLLGLKNYQIIELEAQTDGQATTVMAAQGYWDGAAALAIYNIDTYCIPGSLKAPILTGYDGWIPCFNSIGDHWSFVKCDDDGNALQVAEKNRISNHCSIGYYWFRSANLFEECYQNYFSSISANTERYVAPLYEWLISEGHRIYCNDVPDKNVHVLGTPDELSAFSDAKHLIFERE